MDEKKSRAKHKEEGKKTHLCANDKGEMNDKDSICLSLSKDASNKRQHPSVFALQFVFYRGARHCTGKGKDAYGNIGFKFLYKI